jgi:DNA-binding response OmpR family regulator
LILGHGDVSIDLAARRAQRAGQALDLTAKEQALLSFFLRHPGQVLTRERIYENVWDGDFDTTSNTLEVHLKELRRKLEVLGPRLLHNRRGQGYFLGKLSSRAGA